MKVNCYTYSEILVGETATFDVTITDVMMSDFYDITGDINPLHTDEGFAIKSMRRGKVVYGMLTASFMSTLAGVYLPGKHGLIHKIEADFSLPVYVGDTLSFTGTVVSKDDMFKTIGLKVYAKNGDGKKVLRGKMRVGVLK